MQVASEQTPFSGRCRPRPPPAADGDRADHDEQQGDTEPADDDGSHRDGASVAHLGDGAPGCGGHGSLKKATRSAMPPIVSSPNSSRTPGASTYFPVDPSSAARTAIQ